MKNSRRFFLIWIGISFCVELSIFCAQDLALQATLTQQKTETQKETAVAQENASKPDNNDSSTLASHHKSIDSQMNTTLRGIKNAQDKVKKNYDASDFGKAIITYIRNNTSYPIALNAAAQANTLIDQVVEKSVVRIKSLNNEFGQAGKYFAASDVDGYKVLKVGETEASAELLVKKYKNVFSGKSFFGFVLPSDPDRFLQITANNLVQFAPVAGGFNSDSGSVAHWTLEGSSLDACFLKNAANQGVFGLSNDKNTQAASSTASHQVFNLSTAKNHENVAMQELVKGLGQKHELSLTALIWRINKSRQNWLTSSNQDAVAQKTLQEYLAQAKVMRETFLGQDKMMPIRYGDRIRLSHLKTLQSLFVTSESVAGENNTLVACSNSDASDQFNDDKGSWWIIKGPHYSASDRWGCALGSPVKAGDVVRLENAQTGQNLSASKLMDVVKSTFEVEKIPEEYSHAAVFAAGKNGIGSINDNWVILAQEGSEEFLYKGRKVGLLHGVTKENLTSLDSFFATKSAEGLLQKVITVGKEKEASKIAASSSPATVSKNQLTQKSSAALEKKTEPTIIVEGKEWFFSDLVSVELPKNNVAWVGFENGAVFEDIPNNRLSIEILKSGIMPAIEPGQTLMQQFDVSSEKPTLAGFASDKIDDIAGDALIVVPPLLSKGAAWLSKPVDMPGSFAFACLARTEENGTIEIILGDVIGLDWLYKIIIGHNGGKSTTVFKRIFKDAKPFEQEVFTINKSENILAGLNPGNFLPYWVSFYQNNLSMGFGLTPGKNIITAWTDPAPLKQPSRVGLGSFKVSTEYTGIKFAKPVKVVAPLQEFFKTADEFNLSEGQQIWLDKTLRVPGVGTINFAVEGQGELVIIFAKNSEPGSQQYSFKIHSKEQRIEVLEWNASLGKYNKTIDTGSQDDFMTEIMRRPLWISFDDQQIFLGTGEKFDSLKLVRPKNVEISEFLNVGFLCKSGSFKVNGIKLSSPVQLETVESSDKYDAQDQIGLLAKDSLFLIAPFDYLLEQDGPSIRFKDRIAGTSQFVGKATQKGTRYEFILAIGSDGLPTMTWTREPENAALLRKKILAKTLKGAGQSIYLAASHMESVGDVDKKLDIVMKGAVPVVGLAPIVAATSSFQTTAAGLALSMGGIALEADAIFDNEKGLKSEKAKNQKLSLYDSKAHSASVYEDVADKKSGLDSSVPEDAVQNRSRLEDQMYAGQKWIASDPDKLVQLLSLYKGVLGLITHPYVIKEVKTKASIIENLESLFQAHEEFFGAGSKIDSSFSIMFDLLFFAYSNSYLTKSDLVEDINLRQTWLSRMSSLISRMLWGDGWVELPALNGINIWLDKNLPVEDKGIIKFSVNGQNDFIVGLSKDVVNLQKPVDGYRLIFGTAENREIQIQVADFSSPVARLKLDKGVLSSLSSKMFWIKLENGKISVGEGDPVSGKTLLEWQDPYPIKGIEQVSISSKNTSIRIEKFEIMSLP